MYVQNSIHLPSKIKFYIEKYDYSFNFFFINLRLLINFDTLYSQSSELFTKLFFILVHTFHQWSFPSFKHFTLPSLKFFFHSNTSHVPSMKFFFIQILHTSHQWSFPSFKHFTLPSLKFFFIQTLQTSVAEILCQSNTIQTQTLDKIIMVK